MCMSLSYVYSYHYLAYLYVCACVYLYLCVLYAHMPSTLHPPTAQHLASTWKCVSVAQHMLSACIHVCASVCVCVPWMLMYRYCLHNTLHGLILLFAISDSGVALVHAYAISQTCSDCCLHGVIICLSQLVSGYV